MRKTSFVKFTVGLAFVVLTLLLSPSSFAKDTESTDVLVGLKTFPMLDSFPSGAVVVGIVYNPAVAESKTDAEAIKAVLDSNVKSTGKVSGLMVPVSDLGKLAQVKVAFVAKGVKGHFDDVAQMAAAHNVLTMSTDMDCVRANKCVLGIISKPIVEIYFSRIASESAKIDFDPAFIMLIKKV